MDKLISWMLSSDPNVAVVTICTLMALLVVLAIGLATAQAIDYRRMKQKYTHRMAHGFTEIEVDMCLDILVDEKLRADRAQAQIIADRFSDLKGMSYDEVVRRLPLRSEHMMEQVYALINADPALRNAEVAEIHQEQPANGVATMQGAL